MRYIRRTSYARALLWAETMRRIVGHGQQINLLSSMRLQHRTCPPQNLTVDDSPVTVAGHIVRRFIEKDCDAGKKAKIQDAWNEASLLAHAQTNVVLGYNYDIPHTQWLGKDWDSEKWSYWNWDYYSIIAKNMIRALGIFGNNAPENHEIYYYCYDYDNECTETTQAYSWDEPSLTITAHKTSF